MIDLKPKLFIMVGLSGSGKSTVAKELAVKHNAIIVSSDNIREEICGQVFDQSKNKEVFKIFHKRIRKYLFEGKNVIADATNITMKSRRAIIENVKRVDAEKICYIISKEYGVCLEDNEKREYPVPKEVLKKQLKRFQIPFLEEGIDQIVIHDMNYEEDKLNPLDFMWAMIGFDQKNPYHDMDLQTHCEFTYKLFSSCEPAINSYENGFYMGARLHDYGKLFTQRFDEEDIAHYFGHSNIGSYYVLTNMYNPSEKCEDKDKFLLDCCFMINYHMFPFSWNTENINKKWKRRFGEYKYDLLMRFHECDITR